MTLKQLEAFYWAATCANFSVAAQHLHLSISSLSKRITELEQSLGQVLFDRSGHRAILTSAGRQLLPGAHQLLEASRALRETIGNGKSLSGHCRFGVGELSALTWLPKLIAAAQQAHPQLTLEPRVDVGAVLEQQLDKGQLDFAIVAGGSSRQTLVAQPVGQARFLWLAAPALAGQFREINEALLQAHALVCLPPGAGTTRIIDDWLLSDHSNARRRIVCNNWGAIAGLLIEGAGIGLLPEGWAEKLVDRGLLCKLHSTTPLQALTYSCQWRRGDVRPMVTQMGELTRTVLDFSVSNIFG